MLLQPKQPLYLALLLAFFTIILSIFYRPLFPIDETRYISVAWEMWQGDNWLVPMKNGQFYTHKPPALFWLINLTWATFGVSEFSARIIVPFIACCNYLLIVKLAKLVYPNSAQAAKFSPIILISFLGWFIYVPSSMFDLLITVFILITYINLYRFALTAKYSYALIAGIGFGVSLLIKGPVAFVYTLPMIITYRYWRTATMSENRTWYMGSLIALVCGIAIVLSWAIPAVLTGGKEYANAIFWEQSAGRIKNSFAHARPFYWYLVALPLLLLPWLAMKQFWSSNFFKPSNETRAGNRFCLLIFVSVLVLFSCFSGKQVHYLYPVLPIIALFLASNMPSTMQSREPFLALLMIITSIVIFSSYYWLGNIFYNASMDGLNYSWGVIPIICSLILMNLQTIHNKLKIDSLSIALISFNFGLFILIPFLSPILFQLYDVNATAKYIHQLQDMGREVTYRGEYHNQFQFSGRLKTPIKEIKHDNYLIDETPNSQRNTVMVMTQRHLTSEDKQNSLFYSSYRGKFIVIKGITDLDENID
ncbi:glycosyltransferase family 39 protein [Psychromonas sp. MME2]|uniref:ArnT family glycosyltransferase n=1 Tax=unclassified Psychromonas TaxID=2614957 RepID=UPI00339D060D